MRFWFRIILEAGQLFCQVKLLPKIVSEKSLKMARNSNENDEDNIDPASVTSNVKNTLKQEVIKELLNGSFQDNKTKLGNDALSLVVEVAKCLVTETCLRASSHALRESCDRVDIEHIEKCLPQLMLDFP